MSAEDATRLEELRKLRQDAFDAGQAMDPLVGGPAHELLAKQVAAQLRAVQAAADEVAQLVHSWQYLAGMCGLFDDLDDADRPDRDWRARIEQALASIEEATE